MTTSPPDARVRDHARARRFDERGIALQTVIIMVVMLAIAGGVAAVLLSRGGQATDQLEQTSASNTAQIYRITNQQLCEAAGGTFLATGHAGIVEATVGVDLNRDGDTADTSAAGDGILCIP